MMMPFPQPEAHAIKPIAHVGPGSVENQVLRLRHTGAEYELAALNQQGKEKASKKGGLYLVVQSGREPLPCGLNPPQAACGQPPSMWFI